MSSKHALIFALTFLAASQLQAQSAQSSTDGGELAKQAPTPVVTVEELKPRAPRIAAATNDSTASSQFAAEVAAAWADSIRPEVTLPEIEIELPPLPVHAVRTVPARAGVAQAREDVTLDSALASAD